MNNYNYRTFNKKTVIQGLETDSSYSSDLEDNQPKNQKQNNVSMTIYNNNIHNSAQFETPQKIEDPDANRFDGCSKEAIVLLKTRALFDNPIKRVLSIWSSLYV